MRRRDLEKLARAGVLLRPYAGEERGALAAGALLGITVAVLQLLQPWPLKWTLDLLTGKGPVPFPVAALEGAPVTGLVVLTLLYLGVSVVGAWAAYGHVLVVAGLVNRVVYRFRSALFSHLLKQSLGFHESRNVGEVITRVVYDTSRLRRGVAAILLRIVPTLFLFVLILVVLSRVDARLAAVFGAGGALAIFLMGRRGGHIVHAARKQRRKEGGLASLVAGELVAVREIQAFGVEQSVVQRRFGRRNEKSFKQEQRVRRLAAGLTLTVEVLLSAAMAMALWMGARAVQAGTLTPGDLLLFFHYAVSLARPLTDLANQTARLGRTAACAERLARIVDRGAEVADRPDSVPAPALRGEIVFESVWLKSPKRRRGGRKWTLQDLSCALSAGRRTAVVGENGAGKSTLLRLVLRLADPDRGRLLLDGRDLRDYQIGSVRGQLSVVFQDSALLPLSVRENIALGLDAASEPAVRAAAEAARVAEWIERLPQGYDTPILRGGHLLSGGERQRLALARALLRDGRIWLLDEPTSGLDHRAAEELIELLLGATRDRTTLWVTHDPAIVARLESVLVLDEGRTVFAGSPREYERWSVGRLAATQRGA